MKKSFIIFVISLLLVFSQSVTTYAAPLTTEFSDKKIIWLGDSITFGYGATSADKTFVSIVDEELGFLETVKYATGGATISKYVAEAPYMIDMAATMDTDADIVMVFGGINDKFGQVPIGTTADTDPELTFYGGLNTLIPLLKTNHATARIILVSPYKTATDTPTYIAEAMKERALFYDIEFINMFAYVGFDLSVIEDKEIYAVDSTHLSDQGNRRLADIFISYLYQDYTPNLHNPLTINAGQVLAVDGSLVAAPAGSEANFFTTDYIPVTAGTTYFYSLNDYDSSLRKTWYDSQKVKISNSTNSSCFETAPTGAAFVRLVSYLMDEEEFQFSKIANYDYKIIFETNDGTEIDSQYVTEYRNIEVPQIPVKEGSTFIGWYTNEILTQVFNPYAAILQDTTLYAKWNVDFPEYIVTFFSDGGTYVTPQLVVEYGSINEPGDPTRDGYTFEGWYQDSGLTNKWNFLTGSVTDDMTLYASWTADAVEETPETIGSWIDANPVLAILAILAIITIVAVLFKKN